MPATGSAPEASGCLRVAFLGTPELAVPTLRAVAEHHDLVGVMTQPDRRQGRGRRLQESSVKRAAAGLGAPLAQPTTLRADSVEDALREWAPELIVVVAYGLILPPEVLGLPRLGCVNLHASLLPRYRGASPIQAAILAGDTETGVTTMLMDEGLDTGPVLLRRTEAVRPDDTAGSLGERLGRIGADLVIETLGGLAAGTIVPRDQDDRKATMTRLLRKADGQLDWTERAEALERRVRAMQPWPSAWTRLAETRLTVWSARVVAEQDRSGLAPAVVDVSPEGLRVGCAADTELELLELQRAGGRRLPTPEFLRGFTVDSGDRFDLGATPAQGS